MSTQDMQAGAVHDDSTFLLEGLLVGGDADRLAIIVTPYLVELERAEITEVEALADPPLLTPGAARAVRLHVRRGARVLGFSSAAALESKLWRTRSSFAVATRGVPPEQTSLPPAQRERTRAFLAEHGIDVGDREFTG